MKKFFIIIPILAFILVVIISKAITNNQSDTVEISVSKDDNYNWQYEIENNSILEFVRKYQIEKRTVQNSVRTVKSETIEKYIFKATEPGTTKVTLKYKNVHSQTVKEEVYEIKVDKKLKIKKTKLKSK